jgi:sterol desaturase/sphingolipid hydroxylase (fatty acid hydroxylase superfamily)
MTRQRRAVGLTVVLRLWCGFLGCAWSRFRYHWDHHLRVNYNYSEIEFLDKMFGTL